MPSRKYRRAIIKQQVSSRPGVSDWCDSLDDNVVNIHVKFVWPDTPGYLPKEQGQPESLKLSCVGDLPVQELTEPRKETYSFVRTLSLRARVRLAVGGIWGNLVPCHWTTQSRQRLQKPQQTSNPECEVGN